MDIKRWSEQVTAVDANESWAAYIDAVTTPIDVSSSTPADQKTRQAHVISDPASRVAKAEAIAAVIATVAPLEGAAILDDGCGSGYIARELARLVGPTGSVVGVDRVDERQTTDGFEFVLLESNQLPRDDESFDLVVSNHVLEHVGEYEQQLEYLREIHRVLRPGGWLYLAVPNKFRLVEAHYGLPLLSWLPQGAADRFVRVTGKGQWYDVEPLSRGSLRGALELAALTPTDVTSDVARRELAKLPRRISGLTNIPQQILEPALQLAPTFVVIAQKR
jgi:2-polyprenyl-3-methyl-5-hydroxy-6-metoxy-1,4-benzoquinol methylase